MSYFTRKALFLFACCIVFIIFLYACKKNETAPPPPVAIAPADSLKAYPGVKRIELSWLVKDPSVKRAIAYCDNGDSVVVPYTGHVVMNAVFNDLPGGNYSFKVFLYDDAGHASSRAKIVTHVYGDKYIQSLTSRQVKDAVYDDGNVMISWHAAVSNGLGTEISYITRPGDTQQVFLERNKDSAVLQNYKPGTYFKFRTLYKPVPQAIDTFYAPYTSAEKFSTFSNPLLTDKGADPWVVFKDGIYYFTYTSGGSVILYATKKMSDLKNSAPVKIWSPPSGKSYSKDIWAPEMHFIAGKWYVYFAADDGQDIHHRMYVIENSSADPLQGQWEFKGELQEPSDNWAIDGTVLQYNNELYMIWSGKTNGTFPQNLYISRMSDPYTLEGSRVMISSPQYSWEQNGAPINEGPEILKNRTGRVFLIYSASGYWTDEYCLGMLSLVSGGNPLDPSDWVKDPEPVFSTSADAGAFGPGHCSFFKSRDSTEDWIIYHARSYPNGGSTNHRNPRIQKFTWNADGTPDFGIPVKINKQIRSPSGEF